MTPASAAALSCAQVLALLSDYVDGELAPTDRAQVEAHLRECPACLQFGERFRSAIRALGEVLRASSRPGATRAAGRLHDALADERGDR